MERDPSAPTTGNPPTRGSPDTSGCLVDGINQILLLDGEPDVLLRRAALDALVNELTPYEVVYLHNALSKHRPKLRFTTLDKLPAEIINLITVHLNLLDIASCVQVNKAWNALWTSKFVVHGMLHQFFLGLLQTTQAKGAMPEDAWALFQQAARQRWHFECGSRWSTRKFPKGCRLDTDYTYKIPWRMRDFEPLYCSGRVVWQKDGRHFLVDDLHEMERQVLKWDEGVLSGTELSLLAITQKLVILIGTQGRSGKPLSMLIVYHFDSKRFLKVSLPAPIISLHADGLKIGLHLYGSLGNSTPATTMYIWQWGGALQLVEPSQPTLERAFEGRYLVPRGFLFHPFNKDVFSAVWAIRELAGTDVDHRPDPSAFPDHNSIDPSRRDFNFKLKVLIDEYKDGEPLLHTHHSYTEWLMPTAGPVLLRLETEWCQEIDSHGGYALCQAWMLSIHQDEQYGDEFLMFNTVTRSFVIRNKGCYFADDTLLRTPWTVTGLAGPAPRKESEAKPTTLAVETPWDLQYFRGWKPIEEEPGKVMLSFNAPGQYLCNETGPIMACDDDFMVIRDQNAHSQGYVVWDYGRKQRLKEIPGQ